MGEHCSTLSLLQIVPVYHHQTRALGLKESHDVFKCWWCSSVLNKRKMKEYREKVCHIKKLVLFLP